MPDENLCCSICRRSQTEVKYLLAGPTLCICDGCIADMAVLLAELHPDWRDAQIERLSKIGN
jgi:ATP-dependent protease Clp ATPase subunit